eukprot:730863-Pleurochrysis_carterae.AAC.1
MECCLPYFVLVTVPASWRRRLGCRASRRRCHHPATGRPFGGSSRATGGGQPPPRDATTTSARGLGHHLDAHGRNGRQRHTAGPATGWRGGGDDAGTEQQLKGRARSESVAKTDSSEPRTPELACLPSNSLNGDLYQSYHLGRQGDDEIYKLHSVGGWELPQARGLRRACAVVLGGALTGRRWPS